MKIQSAGALVLLTASSALAAIPAQAAQAQVQTQAQSTPQAQSHAQAHGQTQQGQTQNATSAAARPAHPDNATLVAAVKADLLRSPDASGLDVKVAARDGVVTLTGTVSTDTDRISAERIARTAQGVRDVDNRILVRVEPKAGDRMNPVGNGSQLPRTSPTPATPAAPALPNGAAAPGMPGN